MLSFNVQFSNRFPQDCRLVRYRIASHIIDKKDSKQAKLWEGGPKWVFPFPARDLLPRARVTSVTSISPKPILRWNRGSSPLRTHTKLWTAAVAACLATLVLAALFLHQSFRLTALSDVVQCLLLFSGTAALIPHPVRSRGRLRLFWTLIETGIAFGLISQLFGPYYEVWLRPEVPDRWAAAVILFLPIVPLRAAPPRRPPPPQDEYAARLRR